jgi:hypothetical protein
VEGGGFEEALVFEKPRISNGKKTFIYFLLGPKSVFSIKRMKEQKDDEEWD